MLHSIPSVRTWACKRQWRIKYKDKIRPAFKGKNQLVGGGFHVGLEDFKDKFLVSQAIMHFEDWCKENQPSFWEQHPEEKHRVRAMLRGYYWRWKSTRDEWQTKENEQQMTAYVKGYDVGLILDYVAKRKGTLYVFDHKTSGEDISNVGTDFWQRLPLSLQVHLYPEAVRQRYDVWPVVLWDVVRKPIGNPKMKKRIARFKDETEESYAARKAEHLESLVEFEDRLVAMMQSEPDKYFVRREIHITRDESEETLSGFAETCREIEEYTGCYPKNDSVCRSGFGMCPYIGICNNTESPDSDKFERMDDAHPGLNDNRGGQNESKCPI